MEVENEGRRVIEIPVWLLKGAVAVAGLVSGGIGVWAWHITAGVSEVKSDVRVIYQIVSSMQEDLADVPEDVAALKVETENLKRRIE